MDGGHARSDLADAAIVVVATVLTYSIVMNAYVIDDAYITFRTIDNWFHGYGLRWNIDERVQSFTHPLWMFLISGCHAVTHEFFFTSIALSVVACIAALVVVWRCVPDTYRYKLVPAGLFLLSSKAFIDYSTSGLENPLSYLLVALFFGPLLFRPAAVEKRVTYYVSIAALSFFNRIDTVVLFVPALGWILHRGYRQQGLVVFRQALLGAAPAIAWVAFSYLYYGFPFPNTYYAKVPGGIPKLAFLRQGVAYYVNSLNWDPPTLSVMFLVLGLALRTRRPAAITAALGTLFYLVYVLRVGASGTHMTGRFFSVPFFAAIVLLLAIPFDLRTAQVLSGVAVLLVLLCPMSPVKLGTAAYQVGKDGGWDRNGIVDVHFLIQQNDGSTLRNFARDKDMPNMPWFDEGLDFAKSADKVRIGGHGPAIGFFGFAAGPHKVIIDFEALSDPLLSHLPCAVANWQPGHFAREVPAGYVESMRDGRNLLLDPDLRAFYDKVLLATRAPLFAAGRFKAIWELNTGAADSLVRAYSARHGGH
jgi:arabinofuranosyltransferase